MDAFNETKPNPAKPDELALEEVVLEEVDASNQDEDDEPLYRYSWKRFVVVATALLTLPAWGPWVQHNVGLQELLLVVPFVIIFSFSIWCATFMISNRS